MHAGATPWLIWSSPAAEAATLTAKILTAAGLHVARMPVATMKRALTGPVDAQPPVPVFAAPLPALPAADFTTFRAACRRHLGRDSFARVDQVYRAARDRTDQQMGRLHRQQHSPDLPLLAPALADIAWPLLGWLRGVQLGPAPDAATALITLHATQAALFGHAIQLRWTPDALGPDPAARLLGDLTPRIAAALARGGRTDTAAATVLSLHLNHAPTRLHCFQVGDIAADGPGPRGHDLDAVPALAARGAAGRGLPRDDHADRHEAVHPRGHRARQPPDPDPRRHRAPDRWLGDPDRP